MSGILHGLWLGDAFFCYVEQGGTWLHPREWKHSLTAALPQGKPARERTVRLWLPQPGMEPQVEVAEQFVIGAALPASISMHLLLGDAARMDGETPIPFGVDMAFWQEAARFVADLAGRQRIVPGVEVYHPHSEAENGQPVSKQFNGRGIWRPCLDEEADRKRFFELAAAMPPASAAYLPDTSDGKGWLHRTPRHILYSFGSAVIDEWVREAAGAGSLRELNRRLGRGHLSELHTALQWWRSMLSPAAQAYLSAPLLEVERLERMLKARTKTYSPLPPKRRVVRNLHLGFRLVPPVMEEERANSAFNEAERAEDDMAMESGAAEAVGAAAEAGTEVAIDDAAIEAGTAEAAHHAATDAEADIGARTEEAWELHFFLYPEDDPSLQLPAEALVDESQEREVIWEEMRFPHAPQVLVKELYKAANLYPGLEKVAEADLPHRLELSTAEAFAFMKKDADRLLKQGYAVQLPSWWTRPERRQLRSRVNVQFRKQPWDGEGLQSWLEFDAAAALGDETVSLQELMAIARQKAPLIRYRGEWMEVDRDSIQKAVAFFENPLYKQRKMQWKDLLQLYTRNNVSAEAEAQSELALEMPAKMSSFLEGGWRHSAEQRRVPAGLLTELRPYQKRGFQWLALMRDMGFGMCLADDMGLGKTVQVITLLLEQRLQRPALIVCPTSVLWNWQKELERFAPSLKVRLHHGPDRLHGDEFAAAAAKVDIVLTSYPLVMRDEADLRQLDWSYFILDEAQHIKNREAKQTKAVNRLRAGADVRIALTGTPVENRLSELWAILDFLNPGLLGELSEFQEEYITPIEKENNQERMQQLRTLVSPFILRRLKTDPEIHKELPEKLEMKSYCWLTPEQVSLYQAVMDQMLQGLEGSSGIRRRGQIMAGLTSLKQICNHPVLYLRDQSRLEGRSGKLRRLFELTEAIMEAGEAVLIFTQYARMGDLLVRALEENSGVKPLFLHGGVRAADRAKMISSFQDGSGPPLFILSLKAGGVGLNLTRANHVIHYDRWWNPAVEEQATDRAFRIGQRRNVQVHKMICHGTLEERIDEMLESKKDLLNNVVGSGEHWMTELENEELERMLALRNV